MTRAEIEGIIAGEDRPVEPWCPESENAAMYRDISIWERERVDALASSLREAWAEIDRLEADNPNYGCWVEYLGVGRYTLHIKPPDNLSLDTALNSGDGSYKP